MKELLGTVVAELLAVHVELECVKKDKGALQNKSQTLESQNAVLMKRVAALENQTATDTVLKCESCCCWA
eukprot:SAG22_NODE_2411_length_2602_cov_8.141830_1_plen_70_part_00